MSCDYNRHYLDNAATTQIDNDVLKEMLLFMTAEYGNPGGRYELGFNAKAAVENARQNVAEFFGADSTKQIVFTSGGTESNNMIIRGADTIRDGKIKRLITEETEHDSILNVAEYMSSRDLLDVTVLPVMRNGRLDVGLLGGCHIKDDTLVSIMFSNNEIGSINDVNRIGEICRKNGAWFHTDCVQAAGNIKISVNDIGCDSASISGHKIHGPKGIGALYVRNPEQLKPLIIGGAEQEFGLRGGTENVAGIVGLGKACEIINSHKWEPNIGDYETELKAVLWHHLQEEMSKRGIRDMLKCNANSVNEHGKTMSIRFDGVDAETMVLILGTKNVFVSAGSACRSHSQEPSRVLKAIGLSDDEARSTIRISLSRFNTKEQMVEVAKRIADVANSLRRMV